MSSKLRKGNVLLITTIFLFAITLVAGSMGAFFIRESYYTNTINKETTIKNRLENKLNETYTIILKNEQNEQNTLDLLGISEKTTINESAILKVSTELYTITIIDTKISCEADLTYVSSTYKLGKARFTNL